MISLPDIIRRKRDGHALSAEEINSFIKQVVTGEAEDSQIGAMLMAMFIKGLSFSETVTLTKSIVDSGDVMNWDDSWIVVDKHSTGGVGDKVSLPLAPALAACGVKVPMVSGRGLDFTGGTLDKLESIPGFKVQCTDNQLREALETVGCFIAGATKNLAPGDKELYKRRDVTATVDSNPLIVASIISKKVAEGTKTLVMDIKIGKAAFLKTTKDGEDLANDLVRVSEGLGVKTRAILSSMDVPLGRSVGNSLEVIEAIECMKGIGPRDLVELITVLGGLLLQSNNLANNLEDGKKAIAEVLQNGEALKRFKQMLIVQGVKEEDAKQLCFGDYNHILPLVPPNQITRLAVDRGGYVSDIDALSVGKASWQLGAGRSQADQPIDYRVGVRLLKQCGDAVQQGDVWCEVHHAQAALDQQLRRLLEASVSVAPDPPAPGSRVLQII